MTDAISRESAKVKEALLQLLLDEAKKSHLLAGTVTIDENFHLGRHGGLMWAYSTVANAALDALPRVGGEEGKVERLPMLYACLDGSEMRWWIPAEDRSWWRCLDDAFNKIYGRYRSQHFTEVNRTASSKAALALYDADLTP